MPKLFYNIQKRFYPQNNINNMLLGTSLSKKFHKPIGAELVHFRKGLNNQEIILRNKLLVQKFLTMKDSPIMVAFARHFYNLNKKIETSFIGEDNEKHPKNSPIPIVPLKKKSDQEFIEFQKLLEKSKVKGFIFETEINKPSISVPQLLFEAYQRGILKVDDKKLLAKVLSIEDDELVIGDCTYNLKVTPRGIGLKKIIEDSTFQKETIISTMVDTNIMQIKYYLVQNCVDNLKTIIPTGVHNHMNLVMTQKDTLVSFYDSIKNKWFSLGYLTSHSAGQKLSKIQFDVYQKSKEYDANVPEEQILEMKSKPQMFVPYLNIKEIPSDTTKILKWGSDYIKNQINKTFLTTLVEELWQKKIINKDNEGLTFEDIRVICKLYDYYKENNIAMPKTDLQQMQDKKNTENMKNKNNKNLDEKLDEI